MIRIFSFLTVVIFALPVTFALPLEDDLIDAKAVNPAGFLGEVIAKPQLVAEVVAPLWGKIYLEKDVFVGAPVKKGQNLARIVLELNAVERLLLNDRTIEINQVAEAARHRTRSTLSDYMRAQKIAEQNPEFKAEAERRKKIYENAVNEYQTLMQQKARQSSVIKSRDPRTLVVTAPISGYISEILFVPGEVNATDEFRRMFTIVDLSTVWIHVDVYEKDLSLIRSARSAHVTTEAFPGKVFLARFHALGSEIAPQTRTIPAYFEVANPGEALKIGVPVRIKPLQTE
ncbi:MAG: efflux RND transporter periplasmic adaptor subunit [Acidobacteria bacterium]|nr:efflux RND transporter periplasmic adaptor subunit [Acidobacteriota bacterium]